MLQVVSRGALWLKRQSQFEKMTSGDTALTDYWKDSSSVAISYQIWAKRLELLMYKCFKRRMIRSQKLLYTKDIRELISKKRSLKKLLKSSSIDMDTRDMLGSKTGKLENKIDKAIADFNSRFVMSSINQNGGTLDKQAFWKLKKVLAPKSISIPDIPLLIALVMRSLIKQIFEMNTKMSSHAGDVPG